MRAFFAVTRRAGLRVRAPPALLRAVAARALSASAGGGAEKFTFQAETKQLLNTVANSLYPDKHVFIR